MTNHPRMIGPPLPPDWYLRIALREALDRKRMLEFARRSLGQRIRFARESVRKVMQC